MILDMTYSFWTKFGNSGCNDSAPSIIPIFVSIWKIHESIAILLIQALEHACYIFVKRIFILVEYGQKK